MNYTEEDFPIVSVFLRDVCILHSCVDNYRLSLPQFKLVNTQSLLLSPKMHYSMELMLNYQQDYEVHILSSFQTEEKIIFILFKINRAVFHFSFSILSLIKRGLAIWYTNYLWQNAIISLYLPPLPLSFFPLIPL